MERQDAWFRKKVRKKKKKKKKERNKQTKKEKCNYRRFKVAVHFFVFVQVEEGCESRHREAHDDLWEREQNFSAEFVDNNQS